MPKIWIVFVCALLAAATQQQTGIDPNGCIEFAGGVCIRCSESTHSYLNYCYYNILGCKKYENGTSCVECDASISELNGTSCSLLKDQGPSFDVAMQLYRYGNPGDRYGGNNYIPISYNEVKSWPTFMAMNAFVTRGEYGHFISRSANPVYSVHYSTIQGNATNGIRGVTYAYKVLYEGTGGGLFLCITQVPSNFQVKILSLTVIEVTQLIDNCIDYELSSSKCMRCGPGFHLEGSACYQNYGGCIKYLENICLECNPYFLLVENRCISDCVSIADARSILFYEASGMSSLEAEYSMSLDSFYKVTTTTTVTTTKTTTTISTIKATGTGILLLPVSSTEQTSSSSSTSFSVVLP